MEKPKKSCTTLSEKRLAEENIPDSLRLDGPCHIKFLAIPDPKKVYGLTTIILPSWVMTATVSECQS